MKNILKLFPYIKGFYLRVATIAGFSLVIAAMNAYRPQIYKQIVDVVTQHPHDLSWQPLKTPLLYLFGVSLIWVAVSYFFNLYSNRNFQRVRGALRMRVFEKLTSLSLDYFDTHKAGAIVQKNNEAIGSFAQWVNNLNYSLLAPIFSIIVVTIILFKSSLWLGLLALGIILVSSLEYRRSVRKSKPANRQWRKHNEAISGIVTETIQNMGTVMTLSSLQRFRDQQAKEEAKSLEQAFIVRGIWNASEARMTLFNELAFYAAILVTLSATISGQFSVGEFVALTAYFGTLREAARSFANFIPSTDQTERDVERLVEVLETKPTFADAPDAVPLERLESIEFKNVSFSYPKNKKGAISGISFKIEPRKNVALVGPSGVGKSTITKLMLRFYPPTSGQILINGQPAETFTHESVREHIGMVMQDVALFNTTVKENLKLANERATRTQLEDAVEQSSSKEFIDGLPKQYNTIVGERGVKLSGGQKQRIAIARAILKDPQLIILDEATSALDSESEKLVQDGLAKLREGRSSLTIAHRLSTVQHADEILVLKNGRVFERGTHAELIKKKNGLYHKLFTLQSATGKISL